MHPPIAVRPLRTGVTQFFDTNFLVLPDANLPELSFGTDSPRWVTETTRLEVIEKLGEKQAQEVLDGNFQTLYFNDLYKVNPKICPVYYWYILAMYNPANVGSEDFFEDAFNSISIKGNNVTSKEQKIYEQIRRRSPNGRTLDPTGKPKSDFLRYLDNVQARASKKAKKSAQDKHPAYLRDIRTLSLILYNTLTSKKDAVFYTTDGDPTSLLLKWLESMTMRFALRTEILQRLDRMDHQNLMRGKTLKFDLNVESFITHQRKVFVDICQDNWKEAGVRLTIRRWNQVHSRFEGDIWLVFTEDLADGFANLHDNFSCPFAENNMLGNWLHVRYHWPPAQPDETNLHVEVTKKSIFNRVSQSVAPHIHDEKCLYRREDAKGDIASWSGFI